MSRPRNLDQRVELQKFSRTSDGQGGFTESWTVEATVWASVTPTTGDERNQAERLSAEGNYEVTIRYRTDVNEAWRLRWVNRDRLMNIRFVQDSGKRELYLTISCERGVAT